MSKTTSYLERYLEIVGDKRLKRTSDEIKRGLDAEAAAKERIEQHEAQTKGDQKPKKQTKRRKKKNLGNKGKFAIKLKPEPDSDPDTVDELTDLTLEIELDQKWYGWFTELLNSPYEGDQQLLMKHILDVGLGEVLVSIQRPEDLAEHIRLTDYSTIKKPEGTVQGTNTV